jgi:hypothetical protein
VTSRELRCRFTDIKPDQSSRLLCHALQFAFKSIAYYIRRATLVNVRTIGVPEKRQPLTLCSLLG